MSAPGNVYALLIGINDYESESVRRLQFAVADVLAFHEILGQRLQLRAENCILLAHPSAGTGKVPVRKEVLRALTQFSKARMGPDDTFLLYFAGHGFAAADKSYLLTVDSDPAPPELLEETAVSLETVARLTRRVTAGQHLLILDACRNNPTTLDRSTGAAYLDTAMARDIATLARAPSADRTGSCLPARAILSACWEGQVSYEYPAQSHGWFSYNLLESLRNHPSELLDVSEFAEQVRHRMRGRAWRDLPQADGQEPHVVIEGRPVRLRLNSLEADQAAATPSESAPPSAKVTADEPRRRCPACGKVLRLKSNAAGKRLPCPACNTILKVAADLRQVTLADTPQRPSLKKACPPAIQDSWTNDLGICFRLISAGQFAMGASRGDSATSADEQPRMTLTIPRPFWAATFPVTNAVVRRFLENTSLEDDPRFAKLRKDRSFAGQLRRGKVDDNLPAVEISHDDAQILCAWLQSLDGRHYRMPVEAEWEYMARAGTVGTFWWKDGSAAEKCAVFAATGPAPADLRRANGWGLIDMLGNVAEWTASAYAPLDSGAVLKSADGLGGDARVVRGGSWRTKGLEELRVSRRKSMFRRLRADDLGVRIVCDIECATGADEKESRS